MQNEQRQLHWQNVYQSKGEHEESPTDSPYPGEYR